MIKRGRPGKDDPVHRVSEAHRQYARAMGFKIGDSLMDDTVEQSLCRTGSWYVFLTEVDAEVTCPICLRMMKGTRHE